jgi:hypothetical protein
MIRLPNLLHCCYDPSILAMLWYKFLDPTAYYQAVIIKEENSLG